MKKLTPVGIWHYIRLTYRSALFILLLIMYIRYRFSHGEPLTIGIEKMPTPEAVRKELHKVGKD